LLRQSPRTLCIAGAHPPENFEDSNTHESYSRKEFESSQCEVCSLEIYRLGRVQVSGSVEEDEKVSIRRRECVGYACGGSVLDRIEACVPLSNLVGRELLAVHDEEGYGPP